MNDFHLVAAELLTTGYCPLDCSYCYIPKTDMMKEMHVKIVENLKRDVYLEKMKELRDRYGVRLEYLGAWGTEPLLSMNFIDLKKWKEEFPELKEFAYSTSMMLLPTPVINKAKEAAEVGIGIRHQISLDGPSWITDVNRKGGSTEKIIRNTMWLVRELNKIDLKNSRFRISFKATWSIDNIRQMVENPERIDEVFRFFNNLVNELRQINKNPNVIIESFPGGTLVVPGKYTSEDGKILAEFFRLLYEKEYPNNYTYRLLRLWDFKDEFSKWRMFTCSAMDSQFGFDGKGIHLCHRTYYYNWDEYVKSVQQLDRYKNWDVSHFDSGRIGQINKYYIVDYKDEFDFMKLYYVMRGHHDFLRFKLGMVASMVELLAMAGQASRRFLEDEDYTMIFALFMNSAFNCPMENILNTGSPNMVPVSLLRLMGNGAFDWLLKDMKRYIDRRGGF